MNMLPQVNYGSDCEDDYGDDEMPSMETVDLEKQCSLGDSIVSCSLFSQKSAVSDALPLPDLIHQATSCEQVMDTVDLSDNNTLSDVTPNEMLCRATSDISNLTIESDTARIMKYVKFYKYSFYHISELLQASDDEDDTQFVAEVPKKDSLSLTSPIYSSKLLSDSAKQ